MDWKKIGDGVITSIGVAVVTGVGAWLHRWFNGQRAIKQALISTQHHMIYETCNRMLSRGHATVAELEDLDHLMKGYEGLGGDGTAHDLYNRVRELPIDNRFEPPSMRGAYSKEIHDRYSKSA